MPERCDSLAAELCLAYTLYRLATMGKKDTSAWMSLQTLRVLEAFMEKSDGAVGRRGTAPALRYCIGNLVSDPSSTRICGLVCQSVGIH